ncbi:hypothetical protein BKA70DRAFT_1330692 [Coprinopsis sp. MPI-PUGE-AT-0042]|nr:hypothetical protein BKA70DRAFT_1330692 [Coprinopsis sp. MPI-PUGE-AT-0042]
MFAQLRRRRFLSSTEATAIPPISSTPVLPLEILFKIIDEKFINRRTDVQSLRSLSLVCREFARYCRPTLFRSVAVCCPTSSDEQYWHAGPGWRKPTISFTPSDFSSFLRQDSFSFLGGVVVVIEELHLVLPNIYMSDLMRTLGLDNARQSTWLWLWILHQQKRHLKNIKRLKIVAGTHRLPGLLEAALMSLVNEAPGLEMLDICGSGPDGVAGGRLLLSTPSSKALCASIRYLELELVAWEYVYQSAASTDPGPPLFPNLKGLALQGPVSPGLVDSMGSAPEPGRTIGGQSSPGLVHLHFQRLGGSFETSQLLLLGLFGRSLRCLHLEARLWVSHYTIPLNTLTSLEYLEVGLKAVVKDRLSSNILEWLSRSFNAMDPSSKAAMLKRLQIHVVINDHEGNDYHLTIEEQVHGLEDEYFTCWTQLRSENRWPTLVDANVFAFVRIWVGGYAIGDAWAPRLLGKYHPLGGIEPEGEELAGARYLGTFCSCSDLLYSMV